MATALSDRKKTPERSWTGKLDPTWEIVSLFPSQGEWTEHDYLSLERVCGDHIRVELTQGRLEVLPVPTQKHQRIMRFMLRTTATFVDEHAPGEVLCSGMRVRLKNGHKPKYRQPDLLYMKEEHAVRQHEEYWEWADLAM